MSYNLPNEYIIKKFYEGVNKPKYKESSKIYIGGCPICREGKSWGKKFRCAFIPSSKIFNCFNCRKTWFPIQWIHEVFNLSYKDIITESQDYDYDYDEIVEVQQVRHKNIYTLPYDSINLMDENQIKFYKDETVIKLCLKYINKRKLFKAINRPKTFYISLNDNIHKNRLVIPFINEEGKILFYQSRAIMKQDEITAKYLSKLNSDKSIFNLQNIDSNYPYLFKFEGPIDSMFVKNGISIGGLDETEFQKNQLKKYFMMKKIWVLDNTFIDTSAYEKAKILIENGETIFIFPRELKKFKDFNDICINFDLNSISPKFIIKNSFSGIAAKLRLSCNG